MQLSHWFPVAAVVLVLTAAPPGQAQDIPDEATRERVADWIERCDGDWSGACGRVDGYIVERTLGRWCRRLEVQWDTPRLVRSADVDHPAADVAARHRHRAEEFLEECVPIYAAALARAGIAASDRADAGDAGPREAGERWEVAPADRVMQAAKRSNLRSGPGTSHDKVGLLEVGDEVRVTGEVGDWLRIEAPGGGEAFIYGPLLAEVPPDRVATAAREEPAPSPDTAAETDSDRAQDIPDAATAERIADWMGRCNAWSRDATLDCEPVADQIMATESGQRCAQLRNTALGLSDDQALQVLRDPQYALSAMASRPDRVRRDVEEFLRDCVPIYAAALDRAGEEAGSSPSQATARPEPAAPQGARERVADWWERCWELRDDGRISYPASLYDLDDLSSDRDAQELVRMLQEDGRPVREAREYADNCGWAFEQARESDQRCDNLMRRVRKTGFRDGVLQNPDFYVDGATRRAIEEFRQNCVKVYDAVLDAGRRDTTALAARSDHEPGQQAAAQQDARTAGTDTGSTDPLHGSIAFSQDDDGAYAWGIAWSFDSAAGAQSEALGQCREYGGRQCAQAGWFREACGALAIGSVNGYGTGWGATTAEAERDALAQCRAVNDDCRIEVARCSQSEQAGGNGQLDDADGALPEEGTSVATVSTEPKCGGVPDYVACWYELEAPDGCYVYWANNYREIEEYQEQPTRIFWSGSCSGGVATGEGTVEIFVNENGGPHMSSTGRLDVSGLRQGRWVDTDHSCCGGIVDYEGDYLDGKRDGRWTLSGRGDPRNRIYERSYVDGHGTGDYWTGDSDNLRAEQWRDDSFGQPRTYD